MSTKTSIKRIALVAVSALGFGMMSLVPAYAGTAVSTLALTATVSAGTITVTGNVNNDATVDDGTSPIGNVYLEVISSPDPQLPAGVLANASVSGLYTYAVDATVDAGEITWTFDSSAASVGTYSFRAFLDTDADLAFTAGTDTPAATKQLVVAAADLVAAGSTTTTSLAVTAAAAAGSIIAPSVTDTNAFYAYLTNEKELRFTVTRTPSGADDGALRINVVASADTDLATGIVAATNDIANVISDTADSGAGSGLAGYNLSFDFEIDNNNSGTNLIGTAGTYTIQVWEDADGGSDVDSTETSVTFSVYLVDAAQPSTDTDNAVSDGNVASLSTTVSAATPPVASDVTVRAFRGLTSVASDGEIKFLVEVSPDADLPSGTIISAEPSTGANFRAWRLGADGLGGRSLLLLGTTNGGIVNTAGTYTVRAWQDTDADNVVDASEQSAAVSFTKGGTVDSSSITTNKSLAVAGDTADTVEIIATSVDADGNAVATAPTISVSPTTAGTVGGSTQIGSSNKYRFTFTPSATSVAGTVTFTSSVAAGTADDKTTTITLISLVNATELYYNSAAGIKTGTSAKIATAGSDTMTVDTALTTIYFTSAVTAADAGKYLKVTTTAGASTSSAAISRAGVSYVKTNADGTITFPVTFTSPAAGDTYTMSIEAGATDYSYVVTYAAVTPTMTLSPVAAGGTVKAKYGDTLNMVASLTDQWLRPLASKTITITIPSTNRNPQTVNKTTDAAGKVTFTLTDAYAATDKLSDVVTFTYSYLATAAATTATNLQKSATVTYTATGPVVGSVAVTSATADVTIDQVEEVSGTPVGSTVTFTATVKDANGVAAGSGILVTFTGGADDKFLDGVATGVTNANGVATASVYRQKTGFASVSASAGGKSGSALPVKWVNTAAHARNVAVAVEPTTIVSEGTATVKATVTDRWGNGVAGISVTFAETGAGRLSATTATTNSTGVAQVDFTSAKNETGSNTISAVISGGQSANLAGFVGTVAVAGVTAGNTTATAAVTVTKDTSVSTADALLEVAKAQAAAAEAAKSADAANAAALLELAKAIGTGKSVEEAADAAAEAIDAANAATDAANLAAEAADAATVAAEEARDAADSATAAVEELATQVATLMAALKAQLTTLANTVAKIAKKVKA